MLILDKADDLCIGMVRFPRLDLPYVVLRLPLGLSKVSYLR